MKIVLLTNYYHPESIGAGIWVHQLATDLRDLGHRVTVVTSFPSYPGGRVFDEYRGIRHLRRRVDGIDVVRTLTYATTSSSFWPRCFSQGAFCVSSVVGGMAESIAADVVYAILPPLPLGMSAWALSKLAGAPLVVNIQDIHPDIAAALGYLRNPQAIAAFSAMERWIYARSSRVVVISEGFRDNLLAKGVPHDKIEVVPNWADEQAIRPLPRENRFRRQCGVTNELLVLYAGGMTRNSQLEPLLEAAHLLAAEPVRFVLAGDGVRKPALAAQAAALGLANVQFLPFQPLERYPEMLAAADLTVASLHSAASFASVPSKVYKQMAAARPVLGIAEEQSELARLIAASGCGICVAPSPAEVAAAIRLALAAPDRFREMGAGGRRFVETFCNRARSVRMTEEILESAAREAQERENNSLVGA